jgi:hypothetical protein
MKKVYSVVIDADSYSWTVGVFDELEEAYAERNDLQYSQPCPVSIVVSFVEA